jgi:hypothetical protein
MNNDSKCFLKFLRENNLLCDSENVYYAFDAFKVHGIANSIIQESRGKYSSKEDFLSKFNLIECIIQEQKRFTKQTTMEYDVGTPPPIPEQKNIRIPSQNISASGLDKKAKSAYITQNAKVEAPTSVKYPPTSVPVPARMYVSPDEMLDKWLNNE